VNANITRDEALKLLKVAGCSRDVIKYGSELLGWDLDKFFDETILAMRSCENDVKCELEALHLKV
jgi:predicted hydrolase (HD superfamily)